MANEERKKRERGILDELKRALAEGFRITPEDRRDLLWEIRDSEGKSEPPRGTQVFGTQPIFDAARQAKTFDPKAFGWLPVDAINNETFIRRANTELNFGPSPMELMGEQVTEANLQQYKEALHGQSRVRKGAFLGGALASDVVNDGVTITQSQPDVPGAYIDASQKLQDVYAQSPMAQRQIASGMQQAPSYFNQVGDMNLRPVPLSNPNARVEEARTTTVDANGNIVIF